MSYGNTKCSILPILLKVLLLLILYSEDVAASSSCQSQCGDVKIPYPFGIGKGCYLEKSYEIKCVDSTTSGKLAPFLSINDKEVVYISLPAQLDYFPISDEYGWPSFGSVRVKFPIVSFGCGGKETPETIMNFTGSPFFIDEMNKLVAVGCNAKASLTHIEPNMVGCELNCNMRKHQPGNSISFIDKTGCSSNGLSYVYKSCTDYKPEGKECDGNGCCKVELGGHRQVTGIRIESNDRNSTTTRNQKCRVAFLTDGEYTLSNATEPHDLFDKRYVTLTLGWVIQTKNHSFVSSLSCDKRSTYRNTTNLVGPEMKCICDESTIAEISYAHCACRKGYTGNAYDPHGCEDINECKTEHISCGEMNTCVNTQGGHHCAGDKKKAILIGLGSGFGALALVSGVWWLRKFLIKRRMTKRKNKFFKRNGGLLLQQQLYTRDGNVETTKIFSSVELEKATENFSENRVLGQGGQGTVYKGMLVDGRTVAVKKSKIVDEDKLQEFINEIVILSQINHRHIVKLLGCCLETEVPMLVYEFILNGNLLQHIHEESDDYTMIWGMRLRISVDVAGALSYLHSSASSPIYHRDIKSTNILLDEKHRAKVADFGTSRSITIDQTHWTTVISGTFGYMDPEYFRSSQYTEKSDVYSFGVVLAELITGVKPVITIQNTQEAISLAEHFKLAVKEKRFSEVVDARIKEDCKLEQVKAVANLAVKCLSSKGNKRPNMREVFMELERISASPEDSHVQVMIDEGEEEEVRNMVNRGDSLSVGLTAPVFGILASPSSSDAASLFPRPTW